MKKIFVLAAVAVVAVLLGVVLWPKSQPAPEFSLPDLNGQTVSNADLQGKVTLINFWYPSCPGCVSEMPKLVKTAQDYAGKDSRFSPFRSLSTRWKASKTMPPAAACRLP